MWGVIRMIINWRNFFIGLVLLNLVTVCGFFYLLFSPGDESVKNEFPDVSERNGVPLTVVTNKEDLTTLMNSYLTEQSDSQVLNYKVILTEKVMLIGTIPAFGKEIDLVMTFEPIPQTNGDLLLEQESISLGQLQLPVSIVLSYISEQYQLPEWITIDASEHKVYAALTEMELNSDVTVKVENFDLSNDDISFQLVVPITK